MKISRNIDEIIEKYRWNYQEISRKISRNIDENIEKYRLLNLDIDCPIFDRLDWILGLDWISIPG